MSSVTNIFKLHKSIMGDENPILSQKGESTTSDSEWECVTDIYSLNLKNINWYGDTIKKMRIIEFNKELLEKKINKLLDDYHVCKMTQEYYDKILSDLSEKNEEFYWYLDKSNDAYNTSSILYFDMKDLDDEISDLENKLYEIEMDIINAGYTIP